MMSRRVLLLATVSAWLFVPVSTRTQAGTRYVDPADPTCGAHSPCYLSIQAVEGVDPGIYHYHPVDHALERIKPGNHGSALRNLALDQPWVETAAVVMIITGFYERLRWKYQARGYRFMCMDAGFLAENICLTAQALSLGACAIAGFIDDALETLLGIDGEDEVPLLLISVGTPASER